MHLLIPYAASHAEGCQTALTGLKLPNLQKLLSRLTAQPLDEGDELSLSPPHERALANALGLSAADGQIPWAALRAQKHPTLADFGGAWAYVTLCHWQADKKQVSMRQIPMQDLSQAESNTFLDAMRPYFVEDGLTLYPDELGRWLAHGDMLTGLATASPDRVLGRSLAPWMPDTAQASGLMRLVSEMQMLLYTHPLNDAREARGALPVNAIWFSGSGSLTRMPDTPDRTADAALHSKRRQAPTAANTLREAALQEDWATWAAAWQALDDTEIKAMLEASLRGEPVQLTLCGERHAQTWLTQPQPLMQTIKSFFGTQPIQNVLEKL
jgi:hypothetical protein